ncbi:MAG: ABC transporter permease, partial [SAR324 cluster bacterium]|nr:ABC transporter permease [SAR324 cluster bacterium]
MNRASSVKTSLLFVATALACIVFADLEINTQNPWRELGRMALGAVTPNFLDFGVLVESLLQTVAFALVGVSLGGLLGFGLA